MRNHKLDIILLGFEVLGYSRPVIARLAGCSESTVLRVALIGRASLDVERAFELIADQAAADGEMVREIGERAFKLIPPYELGDVERRRGYIRVHREKLLEGYHGGDSEPSRVTVD